MKSSPGRSRAGSRGPRKGRERAAAEARGGAQRPVGAARRGGSGAAAGPVRRRAAAPGAGPLSTSGLFERLDRGEFPASLYLDGPSEALKAALLAELRHAWAKRDREAQPARVFRTAESSVEEILAAYQGISLFSPR